MIADEGGSFYEPNREVGPCPRVDFDTSGRSRSQLPMITGQQWIELTVGLA